MLLVSLFYKIYDFWKIERNTLNKFGRSRSIHMLNTSLHRQNSNEISIEQAGMNLNGQCFIVIKSIKILY